MPAESSIDYSAAGGWAARFRACWRFKLALTVLLNLFFWLGYGYLSRHAIFPIRTMPVTWLDEVVPYSPAVWSIFYVSEFLFTAVVPWLIASPVTLRRYAAGLVFLSGLSFVIFVVWPVASPRPIQPSPGFHGLILSWDGPYNAFPSLHAGFLVYTLMLARRIFVVPGYEPEISRSRAGSYRWIGWGLILWAALVLYSTLATRQHYFVDLVAGAILGWAADRLAWHFIDSAEANPATTTLRRNGEKSQAGCR